MKVKAKTIIGTIHATPEVLDDISTLAIVAHERYLELAEKYQGKKNQDNYIKLAKDAKLVCDGISKELLSCGYYDE